MPTIAALGKQRLKEVQFEVSPIKKLVDPISTYKPGMVVHLCHSSYWGDIGKRIIV
jgi:hypothetical protein